MAKKNENKTNAEAVATQPIADELTLTANLDGAIGGMSADNIDEKTLLEALKEQADTLGITYPQNIGAKKLSDKIGKFLEDQGIDTSEKGAPAPTPKANVSVQSDTVLITNTTTSPLGLRLDEKIVYNIYPKQMASIPRDHFDKLKSIKVIRHWLEKGCLMASADAHGVDKSAELSVQEAPVELTNEVSKTEGETTITSNTKELLSAGSAEIK